MTLEQRIAALEAWIGELADRLVALERRQDQQTADNDLRHDNLQEMKEGLEVLEKQTPVNSATREVMWQRIEALEGAPSEGELPPVMADILRRLAVLEERVRWQRS
jgi:hypothetical protein